MRIIKVRSCAECPYVEEGGSTSCDMSSALEQTFQRCRKFDILLTTRFGDEEAKGHDMSKIHPQCKLSRYQKWPLESGTRL